MCSYFTDLTAKREQNSLYMSKRQPTHQQLIRYERNTRERENDLHFCSYMCTNTVNKLLLVISPRATNWVCLSPNFHCSPISTHTHTHEHSHIQQVDAFLEIRVRRTLSNLSSHILLLTHVYQRHDPHGYLGNQTGSVGGQSFQVLLLSSLCFPLVTLQEQT